MQLDQLAINARLRSPWESIDLGIALARRLWLPLFIVWLLPALLVLGLTYWFWWESPLWSMLLVWWLKPVYDRLPLFVASRALFGEKISAGTALRQFFAQNRRDWFAWLTWRRLSPTRAFDMPLTMLEQSSGSARSARLGVLHRNHANAATWLTLTAVHIELFLSFGFAGLVLMMIPEQVELSWALFIEQETTLAWIGNLVSVLVLAAVGPFYVCAGFMLYIGRRIELEGWDIEIQFRRLLARREQQESRSRRAPTGAVLALLAALLTGLGSTPAPAVAQETVPAETAGETLQREPAGGPVLSPQDARDRIDQVLASDAFHRTEMTSGWRLKEAEDSEDLERIPDWLIWLLDWLASDNNPAETGDSFGWSSVIGALLELLLWIALIGLVVYGLWRYREPLINSLRWRKTQKTVRQAPETLFGLDVRTETLPEDICAEVMALWRDGEQRASVGLLYRATLAHLIEHFGFHFGDHLTESECASLVKHRAAQQEPPAIELASFVHRLTGTWQQLAYAHRPPSGSQLQTLCDQWQEVFTDER